MSYEVNYTKDFAKALKHLKKRYKSIVEDVNDLVKSLHADPLQGVDLGNGFRKIRLQIKAKNKGKSAGGRVITHNLILSDVKGTITLLFIYDKSDRESISIDLIKEILEKNIR